MKKEAVIILIILLNLSCSSLTTFKKSDLLEFKNIKRFNISDFKTYVFNICEKYGKEIDNSKRFCECPDNFFDVAQEQQIRKVEELYLLIHRETDMVLYLTTTSHKYIYKKPDGFLNDPEKFKDNIVLNEIENIYIGRKDTISGLIHFPSFKDKNDIILHYDRSKFPESVLLTSGNLATAENDYDISEEIPLSDVFNQELIYKHNKRMSFKFYRKVKKTLKEEMAMEVDRLLITSKKGKVDVLFGFNNIETPFQYSKVSVRYHPNFSLIREH